MKRNTKTQASPNDLLIGIDKYQPGTWFVALVNICLIAFLGLLIRDVVQHQVDGDNVGVMPVIGTLLIVDLICLVRIYTSKKPESVRAARLGWFLAGFITFLVYLGVS